MRNVTYAALWAIAAAVMVAGAVASLEVNVIFAMMFTGLAIALFLVALSCLLLDPRPRAGTSGGDRSDDERTGDGRHDGDHRRKWGPR
ncbi:MULTISPECIES: hypothetical protein [unclassified Lysobacter]